MMLGEWNMNTPVALGNVLISTQVPLFEVNVLHVRQVLIGLHVVSTN